MLREVFWITVGWSAMQAGAASLRTAARAEHRGCESRANWMALSPHRHAGCDTFRVPWLSSAFPQHQPKASLEAAALWPPAVAFSRSGCGTDPGIPNRRRGWGRAMHLLAAGRAGVAHITPQVDPVPDGHTGEGASGGHSPRRGSAGAGQGQRKGQGPRRGRAGRGGRGAPGAVRMFGRTSQ